MSLYKNTTALEQIRAMYPRWYLDIYEMAEIINTEALLAEKLQNSIDYILDNHFIDTIDIEKAMQLEQYLNITGISDRPIEEQRSIIKTYFIGRGSLSMSQIIAIVEALSNGKCSGTFLPEDVAKNNYISLRITDCDIKSSLVDIISTLKSRVPAHLAIKLFYIPRIIKDLLCYKHCQRQALSNCASLFIDSFTETALCTSINCSVQNSVMSIVALAFTEIPIVFGGKLTKSSSNVYSGGNFSTTEYSKTIKGV